MHTRNAHQKHTRARAQSNLSRKYPSLVLHQELACLIVLTAMNHDRPGLCGRIVIGKAHTPGAPSSYMILMPDNCKGASTEPCCGFTLTVSCPRCPRYGDCPPLLTRQRSEERWVACSLSKSESPDEKLNGRDDAGNDEPSVDKQTGHAMQHLWCSYDNYSKPSLQSTSYSDMV